MRDNGISPKIKRLGLHYFPDAEHYRVEDLDTWLPELEALGVSWLTLQAPADRAIPESFVTGLLEAGIEPVIHIPLSLHAPPNPEELKLLVWVYARWGVHYLALFDRPNRRDSWPGVNWAKTDLVERFLDIYLPLVDTCLEAGLIPVFPPLEPGGDYWDTAFLRAALEGIQQRGRTDLLDKLVIGAYAWFENRDLNWGAGGPERWPGAQPYFTPEGEQDQRGFRVFDWYSTISEAVLGEPSPILILAAGEHSKGCTCPQVLEEDEGAFAHRVLTTARLVAGEFQGEKSLSQLDPVPDNLLACNFWLLSTDSHGPAAKQAWFHSDGRPKSIATAVRAWTAKGGHPLEERLAPNAHVKGVVPFASAPSPSPISITSAAPSSHSPNGGGRSISHYLLLPKYEWGIADWHLEVISPFVKNHQPTVGFSFKEASLASRVTVIGGAETFPEESLQHLRAAGCQVERVAGDGAEIATQLESI